MSNNKFKILIVEDEPLMKKKVQTSALDGFFRLVNTIFMFSCDIKQIFAVNNHLHCIFDCLFNKTAHFNKAVVKLCKLFIKIFSH